MRPPGLRAGGRPAQGPLRDPSPLAPGAASSPAAGAPGSSSLEIPGETPDLKLLLNSHVSLCPQLHPVLPAGAPSRPPDRRSRPQSPSGLSRGAGASRGRGPSVRHHFLPPLLLGGRYVMVLTHKWKISML